MCDVCKEPVKVPVFTISIFTGERLTLCLKCAENKAEPLFSIVHGINAGALDMLPRWMKKAASFYVKGRYYPVSQLKHVRVKNLPPPPPPEDDALIRIVQKAANLPKVKPTKRGLFSATRLKIAAALQHHAPFYRSGAPAQSAALPAIRNVCPQ